MFKLCCLCCEYAELHAPSSFGLNELLEIISHFLGSYGYKYMKITRRKYLTVRQTPVSIQT